MCQHAKLENERDFMRVTVTVTAVMIQHIYIRVRVQALIPIFNLDASDDRLQLRPFLTLLHTRGSAGDFVTLFKDMFLAFPYPSPDINWIDAFFQRVVDTLACEQGRVFDDFNGDVVVGSDEE